jgi:hypothetical protein
MGRMVLMRIPPHLLTETAARIHRMLAAAPVPASPMAGLTAERAEELIAAIRDGRDDR